jgi:hypothetical protein
MVSEDWSRTGIVIGISKDVVPLSFDSEDEGTEILRNVGNCLPVDLA